MELRENQPHHVLIIEDDPVIQELIVEMCQTVESDVVVDCVTNGAAAERILERRADYNLVVIDVGLTGQRTGVDVWRACRKRNPSLPFVFISALPEPEFRVRVGLRGRRLDFLQKPFSILRFKHLVLRYFMP